MNEQQKIMIGAALATGLLVVVLSGCGTGRYGSAGQWQWTPPNSTMYVGNAGSSSAVIVSPGRADAQFFVYASGTAPEFSRRDEALNIRTNDPYAGWMGYPQAQRASLNHQRTYYTSQDARRYTYPTNPSNDHGGYRPRYRSGGRRHY